MEIIEKIYRLKKDAAKNISSFYRDYFTIDGMYTSLLPDKIYLKKLYKAKTGKELNLKNPTLFTEKLNWLKLYNRKPEYTVMADKYLARDFIAERIGKEYLVPLLAVYDSAEEIDFDALPNQFVLKCNHDSEVVICKDKKNNDFQSKKYRFSNTDEVRAYLKKRIGLNYFKASREWPYKNIPRKIVCEKFMENTNGEELHDYKLFVFNGKVKLIEVNSERFSGVCKEDHYDTDWNHFDVTGRPMYARGNAKPAFLNQMIEISEKIAKDIPFIRVDFNYWNNNLYVGEFTFFYSGGMKLFKEPWESKMGEWIELPPKTR